MDQCPACGQDADVPVAEPGGVMRGGSGRIAAAARAGAIVAMLAAGAAGPAQGQWQGWDADFDENRKPWKEFEAKLPPPPRPESLRPFDAGGTSAHRFLLDAGSLSIGEDGVVRYTLVVHAAGGATNVSFEGIRCDTREQKVYALGRPDGSWVRARDPRWRRIEYQERNSHHGVLYRDYLCEGESSREPAKSVDAVLQRLQYGPPPAQP